MVRLCCFILLILLCLNGTCFSARKKSSRDKEISQSRIRLKRGSEVGVVQKKVFTKRLRFEFTPIMLGTIINDPFIDTYLYGISFGGHIGDFVGAEILYFHASSVDNDLNRILQNDFGKQVVAGKTKSFYAANFLWTPLYGKFSLIKRRIIHFDTFFTVGYGQTKTDFATKPTVNVGVGQRFFINSLRPITFRN